MPSMTCSMPPPPVLMTTPPVALLLGHRCEVDPGVVDGLLPAAIAKWTDRLIRRAIFGSIAIVGSKPFTSAAIRSRSPIASKLLIGPARSCPR